MRIDFKPENLLEHNVDPGPLIAHNNTYIVLESISNYLRQSLLNSVFDEQVSFQTDSTSGVQPAKTA